MNQQINTSRHTCKNIYWWVKSAKFAKDYECQISSKKLLMKIPKLSHDILLSVWESSYRGGESNVFQGTAKTPQGVDFWARTTKAFAHPWEALGAIERHTLFTPFSPRQRRQAPQKSWFFFLFFFWSKESVHLKLQGQRCLFLCICKTT